MINNTTIFSAWNPGIGTGIPSEYRQLETIFWPENTFSSSADIAELASLTGLPAEELTRFRPERLALHEIILRVTAEIAVPEGELEENFGQNFRAIAERLFVGHVTPQMEELVNAWTQVIGQATLFAEEILIAGLFAPLAPPPKESLFKRWIGKSAQRSGASNNARIRDDEHQIIAAYKTSGLKEPDPLRRAVFRSLYRVLGAIQVKRGAIGSDLALLLQLVVTDVGNTYGSQVIGKIIDRMMDHAMSMEKFVRVPSRAAPVLISLKGASASGKSSLRPMIKQTLRDQGIETDGYATISPDVWRRLLLNYESLGPAIKYAGHLTSRELMIVDGKLDRYIRAKADHEKALPHLVVDRFRFDSFSSEKVARVLHKTYAHHVDTLLMYFVITPPEETVTRGWQRGIERGRYKAVEDFLGHSIEAYEGMPKLLFKWLAYDRPEYRYVFLDNRVPKGSFPKTIAVGNQAEMTIYDPESLINIVRYQKINVHATSPDQVYPANQDFSVAANAGFIKEILRRIPVVNFHQSLDNTCYARSSNGRLQIFTSGISDVLETIHKSA